MKINNVIKILILLAMIVSIENIYAKSQEVYLLPSEPGKPGRIIPHTDKASVYWLIQYDQGTTGYLFTGLLPGDTLGVFFEPPTSCSLVEVHFCKYGYEDGDAPTYWGLVADVPDGITLDDYEEYHSDASLPGPPPIGDIFAQAEFDFPYTGDWQWDTLDVPTTPDIGANAFWAGTVIGDTTHSTRVDAGVSPPYHGICFKQRGAGPNTNGPGWYSSWHLFWIRALVKVYGNISPAIEAEELLGTYYTGDRTVSIYTEDFDPDRITLGIDDIHLYYYIDNQSDTVEIDVINDSVLYPEHGWEYGWWHAIIPGQLPETKVTYWVEGIDGCGAEASTQEFTYMVGEGISGNGLLYIESDENWGSGIHDAFSGLLWDLWYERTDGIADNTVTDFYVTGDGSRDISWLAFNGTSFAKDLYGWSFTQVFKDFMDNGGHLFLCGQDIPGGGYGLGYDDWIAPPSPHPLRDYLKAYAGDDDYILESPFTVTIENTDILTTGMPSEVTVDCDSIDQPTWVGIFTEIDDECVPLFFDDEGNILGYRYEDSEYGFRLVFLYFPFNAIIDTNAQDIFIYNLTSWFDLGVEEEPEELVFKPPVVTPNPLSRNAKVSFIIPNNEQVSIKIYDVTGSLLSTLINKRLDTGEYNIPINIDEFASGVYFLKMDAGEFSGTRKFLVLK
ncbi:T9SS type A sorting domain-containing protein [candidate division WOR-3 bacterium]|nr:T9SS type A sorting domain-containing protein [candidate division WOR-3 bacterium]